MWLSLHFLNYLTGGRLTSAFLNAHLGSFNIKLNTLFVDHRRQFFILEGGVNVDDI